METTIFMNQLGYDPSEQQAREVLGKRLNAIISTDSYAAAVEWLDTDELALALAIRSGLDHREPSWIISELCGL